MKKLFQAIRHEDLQEVKAILEKKPEAISSIATPPPKKDMGQSPLQVAFKTGALEIARYLIEQGADVNFMEDEEHGSDWRTPVLHDAISAVLQCLCYGTKYIPASEEALELTRELLKRGADINKLASNDFDALDTCVHDASYILDNSSYSDVYEFTKKQLVALLDLMIEYGADLKSWANRKAKIGEFNRTLYLDNVELSPGSPVRTAHTKAVLQAYCRDRKIEF